MSLHLPQPLAIHEVPGGRNLRHVQGHEIRQAKQFLDAVRPAYLGRQAPGGIDSDLGVEAYDLHAEPDRHVGNETANLPQPDDAEGAMGEFDTDVALLALLHPAIEGIARLRETIDEMQGRHDVAHRQQHPREHEFLHRIGVGTRSVENRHPTRAQRCNRDVVGARPGASDRKHRRRDVHVVHVRRSHQDRVRRRLVGSVTEQILRKPGKPLCRDVVQREKAEPSHSCARTHA